MNSEFHSEPANDYGTVALETLAAPPRPRRPLLWVQLARPLAENLILTWTSSTLQIQGALHLDAGETNLLEPLPECVSEVSVLRPVELRIEAAVLEDPATEHLRPLELWRRHATFSLWSAEGPAIRFAGGQADAANENAFFVTFKKRRIAVDFEQLTRLRLSDGAPGGGALATLTLAPCLYSSRTALDPGAPGENADLDS